MASWAPEAIKEALQVATTRMGYEKLLPKQREAVAAFALGRDVFVCLPTGYGKSFCYGCLPVVFDHLKNGGNRSIVIIVTPLVAIMKEQATRFQERGISVTYITTCDEANKPAVLNGEYRLVFISPEQLLLTIIWRDNYVALGALPEPCGLRSR